MATGQWRQRAVESQGLRYRPGDDLGQIFAVCEYPDGRLQLQRSGFGDDARLLQEANKP